MVCPQGVNFGKFSGKGKEMMTERLIIITACILAPIFIGCKSAPEYRETRIIDTVLSVAPPAIHDTLRATTNDSGVVSADRINGRDTVIKVRYYPRTNTVTVYAKPDTVRLKYRDTTIVWKQATYKEEGGSWWWLLIVVSAVIVGLYMYVIRRK